MRLLVTRPEPGAARTAAALRAQGHVVTIAPLLRIKPIGDAKLGSGPWAALLVTSANAALAIAAHQRLAELKALPVFAVGRRSAEAMTGAGFVDVHSADGNVNDLATFVTARAKRGAALLYLAGAERSGDLAGALQGQGFAVETAVLYQAHAADRLPPAATQALANGLDGILHFSRRSVTTYVAAARASGLLAGALKPVHFCLSEPVAAPLREAGAAAIRIAAGPTEAALLDLIGKA